MHTFKDSNNKYKLYMLFSDLKDWYPLESLVAKEDMGVLCTEKSKFFIDNKTGLLYAITDKSITYIYIPLKRRWLLSDDLLDNL